MKNRIQATCGWRVGFLLVGVLVAGPALVWGQQPGANTSQASPTAARAGAEKQAEPGSPQQSAAQAQQQAPSQPQLKPEPPKNDRLFWALPNYLTVENESDTPPMTAGQKFKLEAKQSFDPVQFPFIGVLALISQAENSEPAYGQGMAGYGRRYGTAFGDAMIGSFMTAAALPAAFHQDPRYFQLGHGGFFHRAGYAVSRIFVTRRDAGGHQFNSSEIAGNLIAAGISNAYHPREDRTLFNTLSIWGTDTGWDTVTNVAKEFWPDIRRMFGRRKR